MNKKQLYETIMYNVSKEIRKALNEYDTKKYTFIYQTDDIYLYKDESKRKIYLKNIQFSKQYVTFNKNDLNRWLYDNMPNIAKTTKNVYINDPYLENNKMCFKIESDVSFDTEVQGEGWGTTLKQAVSKFLDGQISDGWGENGVGYIKIKNKEYTLFA